VEDQVTVATIDFLTLSGLVWLFSYQGQVSLNLMRRDHVRGKQRGRNAQEQVHSITVSEDDTLLMA
jgi:hypothetical protein